MGTKCKSFFKVLKSLREVGGGQARWVIGIKEDTCDEHWVWCEQDKSLNSTPETNNALYIN